MYRFFGKWMKSITKEWQMYPVGVVFGMGFDTATEVALLATTALLASQALPWYSIMCLPVLFTAGMSLMDTLDGCFMNVAYGWAFFNPVRKVYYNLAITGLSVAICFFIGTIEVLGLLPMELHIHGVVLGLHGQLQHQHRRIRHRGHVRRDLGRRIGHLEVRPRGGEMVRPTTKHRGIRPFLTDSEGTLGPMCRSTEPKRAANVMGGSAGIASLRRAETGLPSGPHIWEIARGATQGWRRGKR